MEERNHLKTHAMTLKNKKISRVLSSRKSWHEFLLLFLNKTIFIIPVILFLNCNYSFTGSNPPEGIKTIFIPTFDDISGFGSANMKDDFTLLLKNKFINDNTLEYTEKTKADGMLSCTIKSVLDEALVVSSGDQVSQRKITITVSVNFQNLKKKKTIWNKDFSNWGQYSSSSGGFSKRDEGIKTAMDKITDDILLEVISNW